MKETGGDKSPEKTNEDKSIKLPQALEMALSYKIERAKQVGVSPDDLEKVDILKIKNSNNSNSINVSSYPLRESDEISQSKKKETKKKKKKKKKRHENFYSQPQPKLKEKTHKTEDIEIQYVPERVDLDNSSMNEALVRYFDLVMKTFHIPEPAVKEEAEVKEEPKLETPQVDLKKVPKIDEDDDDYDSDEVEKKEDEKPKLSKRKLKELKRMSVAELKQTVNRPDVVEMHDITAKDPTLLVHLKATRNTVPVPRHWCFKRKYLQGKRGIEKPPFELPDFIKKTGIMEMRAALQEKEDQKTLKTKMRDKVRPKMGKIDIDYHKLHDAFFKWQTKPKVTIHGDLYYEGKEFETKMKDKKPGEMSDELRISLGMPIGANAHKVPPPWLIAMQRYGPPPSYPNLKIPGLNAPIPEACSFGYHAGGWGKPPVDNMGKPIYGDVFGTQNKEMDAPLPEEEIDRTQWGALESESEEESEEEEEDDEREEEERATGIVTPAETGLVTPSGITSLSLPAGLETPDMIELRKKRMETEIEGGDTPALYTVLPERRGEAVGRSMMGSTHTYDLSAAPGSTVLRTPSTQGVEISLDPSEIDLMGTDAMAAKYDQGMREMAQQHGEDFSEMVAEHAAKQRYKRKKQAEANKPSKKYKDFKF